MNYKIAVLVSTLFLAACGQSGALQLPNDPNYDQRAKYLIYKNTDSAKSTPTPAEQPASAASSNP